MGRCTRYQAAAAANAAWTDAKQKSDALTGTATQERGDVLVRQRQGGRMTCELCTISTVVTTLSGNNVSENDVRAKASLVRRAGQVRPE